MLAFVKSQDEWRISPRRKRIERSKSLDTAFGYRVCMRSDSRSVVPVMVKMILYDDDDSVTILMMPNSTEFFSKQFVLSVQ